MTKVDVPGLGPRTGVPKLAPSVSFAKLKLDATQGFVLSRVDGRTSLGEIILLMPLPEAQTTEILKALHAEGIVEIPGVPRPPPPPPPAPVAVPVAAPPPTDGIDLSHELRARIDDFEAQILNDNPFALLGLAPGVDKRDIKRAYFKLSKEFHPDRYFGRALGPYQRRLQDVFTALSAAFELLSDDVRRAQAERDLKARSGS